MWQARGKADCRYTVQFLDGGSHDVRVQRILPVVRGPAIILTPETEDFRSRPSAISLRRGLSMACCRVICAPAGQN